MVRPRIGRTFELETPKDYLRKLKYELDLLRDAEIGPGEISYVAMNAAATAWHMTDWLHEGMTPEQRTNLANFAGTGMDSKQRIQDWAREASPFVHVCRQLATASKHWTVDHHADDRVRAEMEVDVRPTSDGGADVYVGLFVVDGEHQYSPKVLIEEAFAFWHRVLLEIGAISEGEV